MNIDSIKKFTASILLAGFMAAFVPPCIAAQDLSATFNGTISANGMAVTSTSSTYTTYSGRKGITLSASKDDTSSAYIKANIDDTLVKNITDFRNVTIDVTYYDYGYGWFKLIYDGISENEMHSEYVYTTGTNQWKTYSFVLKDAQFNNASVSGMDFLITVYDNRSDVTLSSSKYSPEAITISSINVYVKDTKRSVTVDVKNNGTGNIFFTGETPTISVDFENRTNVEQSIVFSYSIRDEEGNVVKNGSDSAIIASRQMQSKAFNLPVQKYGLYRFNVEISGTGIYDFDETGFSYCMLNEAQNDPIGFCVGWTYTNRILPTMIKAGFQNVRARYGNWDAYCDSNGNLRDGTIEMLKAETKEFKDNGFDVILSLNSLPNYWKTSGYTKLVTTESGYNAFGDFAEFIAENVKGSVDYFEILNEPDLENGTALSSETAFHYAQMVKKAYNSIKAIDENLQVGIMSPSTAWQENRINWAKNVLSNFDKRYFDYITLHPYAEIWYPHVPEERDIHTNFDNWRNALSSYQMDYNDSFLLTEFGYQTTLADSSTHGNATEIQARNRQIRQLPIILADNMDHELMIFDWADAGTNRLYKEHNFGILHAKSYDNPLEAKPVFPAICAYNNLTSNAIACEQLLGTHGRKKAVGNNFVYKYTLDDRMVYMLWNCEGTGTVNVNDYLTNTEDAVYYDIYGNLISGKANSQGIVNLTEEPFYIVEYSYENITNFSTGNVSMNIDGSVVQNNQASLVVLKPGAMFDENWWKNAEFLDQYTTDSQGAFDAQFNVSPSPEVYNINVSNSVYPIEFTAVSQEIEEINIYRDNELLSSTEGLSGGDNITVKFRLPAEYYFSPRCLVCVYYKDGKMQEMNTSNATVKNEIGFISQDIEILDSAEFDELRIMVWNSILGMVPLKMYKSYKFGD